MARDKTLGEADMDELRVCRSCGVVYLPKAKYNYECPLLIEHYDEHFAMMIDSLAEPTRLE